MQSFSDSERADAVPIRRLRSQWVGVCGAVGISVLLLETLRLAYVAQSMGTPAAVFGVAMARAVLVAAVVAGAVALLAAASHLVARGIRRTAAGPRVLLGAAAWSGLLAVNVVLGWTSRPEWTPLNIVAVATVVVVPVVYWVALRRADASPSVATTCLSLWAIVLTAIVFAGEGFWDGFALRNHIGLKPVFSLVLIVGHVGAALLLPSVWRAVPRVGPRVSAALLGVTAAGVFAVDSFVYRGLYQGVHVWLSTLSIACLTAAAWLVVSSRPTRSTSRTKRVAALVVPLVALTLLALLPFPSAAALWNFRNGTYTRKAEWARLLVRRMTASPPARGADGGWGQAFVEQRAWPPNREPLARHVVLITLDAQRPDTLGPADIAGHAATPHLDELIAESLTFSDCIASGSRTNEAFPSIYSGRCTDEILRENWRRRELPHAAESASPPLSSLPKWFAASGYRTTLVSAPYYTLEWDEGLKWAVVDSDDLRWWEGFRTVHTPPYEAGTGRDADHPCQFAGPVVEQFEAVAATLDATEPNFIMVKFLDHFVEGVERVDPAIARIRSALVEAGIWDEALVIVLADHGYGRGEHGSFGYGTNVYQETIHVPCFVRVPDGPRGTSDLPISHVDLFPTLVDAMALGGEGHFAGRSFATVLRRAAAPWARDRVRVSWSIKGAQATAMAGSEKLIYDALSGSFSLYDLATDPGEAAPRLLGAGEPHRLRDPLEAWLASYWFYLPSGPAHLWSDSRWIAPVWTDDPR